MSPWKFGDPFDSWLCPQSQVQLELLIAQHQIEHVLEIGTCYGCSAIWFAQRVPMVVCVDMWVDIPEHFFYDTYEAFNANTKAAGVAHKVRIVSGDSHDRCTRRNIQLIRERFDLVYLDGDHTYKGCASDIRTYGRLAGKILCGDDYDPDSPDLAGVVQAVDQLVPSRQIAGRFWWMRRK